MARVALFDDERMGAHRNGPHGLSHPERPARLDAVREALAPLGLTRLKPRLATDVQLLRVHSQAHLEHVAQASQSEGSLDPDTACVEASNDAARLACGSIIGAVERVLSGKSDRAFCAVRPPGHHAKPGTATQPGAMGFCLYSTVAVGVQAALARPDVNRVVVLDFDVHHGNGTQDAFYDRGDVLVVNWHQSPFFPGTGSAREIGTGAGVDTTLNIPLALGDGDDALLSSWRNRVRGVVQHFGPDLVMVSAGFDGDARDPLGGLSYSPAGYATLTEEIVSLADDLCAGRVVSSLEGGYDVQALAEDVRVHVDALR